MEKQTSMNAETQISETDVFEKQPIEYSVRSVIRKPKHSHLTNVGRTNRVS